MTPEIAQVIRDLWDWGEGGTGAASCEVSFMEWLYAEEKRLAAHPLVIEALKMTEPDE